MPGIREKKKKPSAKRSSKQQKNRAIRYSCTKKIIGGWLWLKIGIHG